MHLVWLALLAQTHPLDGLVTKEYWAIYDTLEKAGHLTTDTVVSSVLLHPPDKAAVLRHQPGAAFDRRADIVLFRKGKSFAGLVDVNAKSLLSFEELKDAQAPFVGGDMGGADELIKGDARVVAALKKRGITDLRLVNCSALPVAYRAIPAQATERIGFGGCSLARGAYRSWGRSIDGLTMTINLVTKKVLDVVDTYEAPVPAGDTNYEDVPENPRPHSTPISTIQPMGAGYKIENGEVSWQNWRFRFRLDPRVGPVLNLVRFVDNGKPRSVMYEGSVSELFVPYMDPTNGWNNRAFIDAGQFYATSAFIKPMRPGLDCPTRASWFDILSVDPKGAPRRRPNAACLFERNLEQLAWRHGEEQDIQGRPTRQLILRTAAVIGNYDYVMDWRFDPDGTIEVAVGATGIIETRSVKQTRVPDHSMSNEPEYGQLVAPNTLGVNHDHYFSYRLDLDVDGPANSFMLHKMIPQRVENDPMRRSIWVAQPSLAKTEQDAILDIRLDQPSMWMFMNPAVKGPLGHNTAYEVMPGATAKSLMSADDPTQEIGAFSAHQFYVTPYNARERYASGVYPTSSKADDGLADWVKANRPIVNTDLVGWYTLGFHHIPRSEDWPVMPTMWHHFHIRPFHFFQQNPVLDLPKSVEK